MGRRRRLIVSAAVVVPLAVGVVAAAVWYVGIPSYRPGLEAGERYGIDVSHHQGSIDWDQVAGDGIDVAYLKATEGGDHLDREFRRNAEGADAAGLDVGAYHFFTLCRPGADQARHFLAEVEAVEAAGVELVLPPAVDLELGGNCTDPPPADQVVAEVEVFVDLVEESLGVEVIVYVLADFEAEYPVIGRLDRPRWDRSLLRRPSGDGWAIWQISGWSRVDGVNGPVDLNIVASSLGAE